MSKLKNRLQALHKQLLAAHDGSAGLTTPAPGREREDFVDIFLRNCVPQGFRFGTGQAVDGNGNESNQLDVVIESTFAPSVPLLGSTNVRLYPVESICAVVEIKSNVAEKWSDVILNYTSVESLRTGSMGGSGMDESRLRSDLVAYFAVGYKGWEKENTLIEKWTSAGTKFDCILQLSPLMIIHKHPENDSHELIKDEMALFRFLELLVNTVKRHDYRFDLSKYY